MSGKTSCNRQESIAQKRWHSVDLALTRPFSLCVYCGAGTVVHVVAHAQNYAISSFDHRYDVPIQNDGTPPVGVIIFLQMTA